MLDWELGKKAHIALSDAAAERYDELYETSNFATGSYMRYEVELLEKHAVGSAAHDLAVDLGCGTGRDSFVLAKKFSQVYAYDFAENMIIVADRNKLQNRIGNVLFSVRDVEAHGVYDLSAGTITFVCASFGMGSFIDDLNKLLREIKRLLKPGGRALISFYNASALVNRMQLGWSPALAARATDEGHLEVQIGEDRHKISARAYRMSEIEAKLGDHGFDILSLTSYPSLSGLMPQELFAQDEAKKLCNAVDAILAADRDIEAGPYIAAVVAKPGRPRKSRQLVGYARVLELLATHDVRYERREHAPVQTMAEVSEVLPEPPEHMAKAILVAERHAAREDLRRAKLWLVVVPADRHVDLAKVGLYLQIPRSRLELASQVMVEDHTGFTFGSVPPFGQPRSVPVLIDRRLTALEYVWCGSGKATESLRLSVDDLRKLSNFSVGDVARD